MNEEKGEVVYISYDETAPTYLGLLVRFSSVFGSLQLDLEPLGANLVAVHGLDGRVCSLVGREGDKAWLKSLTFATVLTW